MYSKFKLLFLFLLFSVSRFLKPRLPLPSAPLKRTTSWSFDEKLLIQSLYKVILLSILWIFHQNSIIKIEHASRSYSSIIQKWIFTCRFWFSCQKPIPLCYICGMLISCYTNGKGYITCSRKC